jgi:hypothetical protein
MRGVSHPKQRRLNNQDRPVVGGSAFGAKKTRIQYMADVILFNVTKKPILSRTDEPWPVRFELAIIFGFGDLGAYGSARFDLDRNWHVGCVGLREKSCLSRRVTSKRWLQRFPGWQTLVFVVDSGARQWKHSAEW